MDQEFLVWYKETVLSLNILQLAWKILSIPFLGYVVEIGSHTFFQCLSGFNLAAYCLLRLEGLVSNLVVKQLCITDSELIVHDRSYQRGHHIPSLQCLDLDSYQSFLQSLETHTFKHYEQLIDLDTGMALQHLQMIQLFLPKGESRWKLERKAF